MNNVLNSFFSYDLKILLLFPLNVYRSNFKTTKWKLKKRLRFIYTIFIKKYSIIELPAYNNKILYADRFLEHREDIQLMLKHVTETFEGKCDYIKWGVKREISFYRIIINILLIYKFKHLKREYSFTKWLYILTLYMELMDVKRELEIKVDFTRYNLCFCYFDSETFQNFIIQYAKRHCCKTASLQHGIMLAPREGMLNNPDFTGHELRAFVSDYFLIWNNFTKREALKTGISDEKLKVLGVSKCIGMNQIRVSPMSSNVGIILDGEFEKQNNKPLITIVQEWAKKHNKKCVFRYHPHFKGTEYATEMDESVSIVCDKSVSLYDFIESVSFCVVANSTVLFELEYFCIPFLRYACDPVFDKYKDYPSIDFTTVKSFDEAYKKMIKMPPKKFVKADDNYASFFKQFIN